MAKIAIMLSPVMKQVISLKIIFANVIPGDKMVGFDNNIYKLLSDNGLTQKEFALKVGIGNNNLNRIINGHASTYIENGLKIAQALGRSFEDVFVLRSGD